VRCRSLTDVIVIMSWQLLTLSNYSASPIRS